MPQGLQTMQAGRALGAPLVAMLLGLMASSAGKQCVTAHASQAAVDMSCQQVSSLRCPQACCLCSILCMLMSGRA